MTEPAPRRQKTTGRHGPSPALLVLLLFPLAGIIAASALMLSTRPGSLEPTPAAVTLPPMPTTPRLMGEPAPDFTLRTLDQTTVSLSDFRGRVVFLNFWATWCGPCERELPAFQAFMAQQPEDGPIILAVDVGETYDVVDAFIAERALSGFPVLLDARAEVADLYGIGPIPVTMVVDKAGYIRAARYGEISMDELYDYLAVATS